MYSRTASSEKPPRCVGGDDSIVADAVDHVAVVARRLSAGVDVPAADAGNARRSLASPMKFRSASGTSRGPLRVTVVPSVLLLALTSGDPPVTVTVCSTLELHHVVGARFLPVVSVSPVREKRTNPASSRAARTSRAEVRERGTTRSRRSPCCARQPVSTFGDLTVTPGRMPCCSSVTSP